MCILTDTLPHHLYTLPHHPNPPNHLYPLPRSRLHQVSKILVLLQPSSAAAERIFSLLQAYFSGGGRRGQALQDVILLVLQLQYHGRLF